jgi:hypothetical protein
MRKKDHKMQLSTPKDKIGGAQASEQKHWETAQHERKPGERVLTLAKLSKMFNISPKKISRWRDVGLESGLFKLGGRRQVGFLQDALSLSYDYRMTAQIFQAT